MVDVLTDTLKRVTRLIETLKIQIVPIEVLIAPAIDLSPAFGVMSAGFGDLLGSHQFAQSASNDLDLIAVPTPEWDGCSCVDLLEQETIEEYTRWPELVELANIRVAVVDRGKPESTVRVLNNIAALDGLIQTRLNTEAGNLNSKRGIIFNHGGADRRKWLEERASLGGL